MLIAFDAQQTFQIENGYNKQAENAENAKMLKQTTQMKQKQK